MRTDTTFVLTLLVLGYAVVFTVSLVVHSLTAPLGIRRWPAAAKTAGTDGTAHES